MFAARLVSMGNRPHLRAEGWGGGLGGGGGGLGGGGGGGGWGGAGGWGGVVGGGGVLRLPDNLRCARVRIRNGGEGLFSRRAVILPYSTSFTHSASGSGENAAPSISSPESFKPRRSSALHPVAGGFACVLPALRGFEIIGERLCVLREDFGA